ncbi:MAG TPA: alpha/beta hydrolase [Caulobacteraceae bacterium]|nr:alpha/beta hydrolase [Caulobacteraceae bacterium]
MSLPVTEHVAKSARHTSFYLACGPEDGPRIIFVHGWPELSISWRHQLPVFGAMGFRAIAPDMRGYGRSSVPTHHEDYAIEEIVADMIELADVVGAQKPIWVGHDWGSPVVWGLASHHPDRCAGVASLCVPYAANGNFFALIDRQVYPEAEYPVGQWDYQLFYLESFDKAGAQFEANIPATVKILFRKGEPSGAGQPAITASVRRNGGWFPGGGGAPDLPRDADILTEQDEAAYVASLTRNGFFGPDSWYMNPQANAAYQARAVNGGRLSMPVLFLHASYDYVCETMRSPLAEPMRTDCADLTETVVDTGHWMAQERPLEVNAALARWLALKFPALFPAFGAPRRAAKPALEPA